MDIKNNNNHNMKGSCYSVSFQGIIVTKTKVECQILPGIPNFIVVGLADKAISESKERIRVALHSINVSLPAGRIIINLSPADLYKEGTHYDLPIAMSILEALGIIKIPNNLLIIGELNLNGEILKVKGGLTTAIFSNINELNLLCSSEEKISINTNINIFQAKNLKEIISFLKNEKILEKIIVEKKNIEQKHPVIYGQQLAKRVLCIAAAGRHSCLFIGPPGCGKSTLAKSITYLLPELSEKEELDVLSIYSLANLEYYDKKPPFRCPHSSSSLASLTGSFMPGELSLSHNGILFLDEINLFSPPFIESLRTPLEEGFINVSRAKYKITYPANIQLIIGMNPCKCGKNNCNCKKYTISGPILDRIDIKLSINQSNFTDPVCEFPFSKENIINARKRQEDRFHCLNNIVDCETLRSKGNFSNEAMILIESLSYKLSIRSIYKIMKIARTISDLENTDIVEKKHILEASILNSKQ